MRQPRANRFAELDLKRGGHTERRTLTHDSIERVEDNGRRVPENQGAPGEHVVDVLASVHVPDPRALTPRHDKRLPTNPSERAHGRIDPTGEHRAGARHDGGRSCAGRRRGDA